jgi:Tfp pilus assembly protein PilF
VLRQALRIRPHDFRLELNLALLLGATGSQREAIARLTNLRDEHFGSALVHYNLGITQLDAGEPGVAASHLEAALALDPSSLGARLALAQAYWMQGDLNAADEQARLVLAEDEWIAGAHDIRARVAARRGDCTAAAGHRARAIRIEPYTTRFHLDLTELNQKCPP